MSSRRIRTLISIGGTVVLLGLVLTRVDLAATMSRLRGTSLGWFGLAALLGPVQILLGGLRWRRVDQTLGGTLGRRAAVGEYGLSTLLNQLLPGGVAGDAVRVWRQRHHRDLAPALRAAVVDRWVGLWVHALLTVVALGLWAGPRPELPVVALVFVGLSAVPVTSRPLSRASRRSLRSGGGFVLASSGALTATFLLEFLLCGRALGVQPGLWVVVGVPLVLLAMVVPVSVGGWGLREASAVAVLPRFGWSEEDALAVSALYGLSALLGALPGALALVGEQE